jgi:hypothetical protein
MLCQMRRAFAGVAFGLLVLAFVVPTAGAAAGVYTAPAVVHAFESRGIDLYNAGYGYASPVTTLASKKAHDGWRVGIYVYGDVRSAKGAYDANAKAWLSAGMAVARARNVVVTVVPNGAFRGKKAKRWPMPALVTRAIAAFSK